MTALALAIALTVAIIVPAGYFWVATSEVASPRSALIQTGLAALLSALLGFAVFYVLRILPMRIIDRTLGELATVETRYRLLFDSNPFPTVVVDQATRRLLAVNEATIKQYAGRARSC